MLHSWNKPVVGGLALAVLLAAALAVQPLHADVETSADAGRRGDDTAAVREWEQAAAQGDPEALFHLAQAYRFGRGVPADIARAEALCARAAALGHTQAADTYGLLLFERGRRDAAIPYLQGAAHRGDPRAQYLLGIAHFNGDFVEPDWPRAYALMTLAKAAGLPQAAAALAEMDRSVPPAQRRQAAAIAEQMRVGAEPRGAAEPPAASGGRWKVQLGAFANRVERRCSLEPRRRPGGSCRLTAAVHSGGPADSSPGWRLPFSRGSRRGLHRAQALGYRLPRHRPLILLAIASYSH